MSQKYLIHITNEPIIGSRSSTTTANNNEFHLHNNYEIYYFISGNVNYFIDQSYYHLKKGNLLIFNSNEIHRASILSSIPYERLVIHFNPQLMAGLSTENTNLLDCFHNHEPGTNNIVLLNAEQQEQYLFLAQQLVNICSSLHKSKHKKNPCYGNDVMSITYLAQILVFINNIFANRITEAKSNSINPVIKSLLSYIENNLTTKLTLDELQQELAIDKYHLSHLFKKETGSTIYNYIMTKRISLAKQLLKEGNNVTDTCLLSGFNDYANFIRTFKKVTGYTPSNYGRKF